MSGSSPKNGPRSSLTGLVISAIVILCAGLIGTSGYIKYQLDRSELALAAPDSIYTSGQDIYEKTLRTLGYGGFLSSAAQVIQNRDKAALADMKQSLRIVRDTFAHLPEKTAASIRHDIEGLIAIYAAILAKAERSVDDPSAVFTTADLTPAMTALPALDSRLQSAAATARLSAQNAYRMWGLALTLVAWISLILTAGLAAGLYLSIHNRQMVPLRALAQSVQNLARGDMDTRIWGMERRDAIGELARAIDLARYHFSRLPDLSLMSEQGPVRLKFEGETRSLFQAMLRNITDEYERARGETAQYSQGLATQREALIELSGRLNALAGQLQQQSAEGHTEFQRLANQLGSSANSVAQTQDKLAEQMGRIVPFMQERAHNMAEVTHIAGTQIAQVLENLMKAEQDLRTNATQSADTVGQFVANTNQMGERIFAAVNLMQASSKALSETTDTVQSRFNEAVDSLGKGEVTMKQIMERVEERLSHTAAAEENMATFASRAESNLERMENNVRNMSDRHEQMSEHIVMATHRMEGIVAAFDGAQRSLGEALQQVRRDGEILNDLMKAVRENNDHLLTGIKETSQTSHGIVQTLADRSQSLMQTLEGRVTQMAQSAETRLDALASNTESINLQIHTAIAALDQSINAMREEHDRFAITRNRFGDSLDELETQLKQQASATMAHTEQRATESFGKLAALTDNMEGLMNRLNVLGQLTGTLGTVAGQLGQLMPSLTHNAAAESGAGSVPALDLQKTEALFEDMQRLMNAGMHETMATVQAMHDQLAKLITHQKDQLEMRLVVMDKKIKEAMEKGGLDQHQIALMNDMLAALMNINENVIRLENMGKDRGMA